MMEYQKYRDYGVQVRRHLHQYPELGREEYETRRYCIQQLEQWGYKITDCFETGFYADLQINNHFQTIAFRADMDALPAEEKNGEVVTSVNPGVAHLCGHDIHMAVSLTAARMMSDNKDRLKFNIRFLFQPSEEMFRGGAKGMVEAGCLKGVERVYGLHNDPQIDYGKISVHPGIMSSNGDQFKVTIEGKSAHASAPHLGRDALSEAVRLLNSFRSIITDNVDPNKAALISTCMLKAGEAPNILARNAEFQGSIRSFDKDVHNTLMEKFKNELGETCRRGFNVELDIRGYPAINNHRQATQDLIDVGHQLLGEEGVLTDLPSMVGSEDFSYFLEERPGAFFFLGSGDHAKGICNPLHSNPFIANEKSILLGALIYGSLVGLTADRSELQLSQA
ncbi:TPA: amidohydrolase [Escherichia albertii]|uniref:M20 metallopeptidase family protein n=1 Tax=Escherichia albertii TaxID=208962 RepID=UPI00290A1D67|nr:amidohydrolase [Escherichia albertii]HEB1322255.1 amidohydrolase [Escherichia albertii]HEB1336025.1 amidohydrolase [Escherichia albertii]HEB1349909.1 amidohydrolase [Escherichia albertii]HEB1354680.1 amidohydrolase [Escherichia albertii]